eukprot:3584128-Pyramimonas_sp.AAC.1
MNFASWGSHWKAPGGLLGRFAGLLGRLEAVKVSWADRSPGLSLGPLGALLARLGASLASGTPRGGV